VETRGKRQDGRRAEERQGLEDGQDEAAQDGRGDEGERDRQRDLEAAGPEDSSRFLQV